MCAVVAMRGVACLVALLCTVAPARAQPPPRCLAGVEQPERSGPPRRITLELDNWATHELLTEAAKILLEEALGVESVREMCAH
eukprot:SAG22_NODE_2550_length_2454_cov_2.338004_2_plen_84_part_00